MVDVAVGAATAVLIRYCRSSPHGAGHRPPFVLGILQSRPAAGLGLMSYSLYLIHPPVLAVVNLWGHALFGSDSARLAWSLAVGTAASVAAGAAFFAGVERFFLPGPTRPNIPV